MPAVQRSSKTDAALHQIAPVCFFRFCRHTIIKAHKGAGHTVVFGCLNVWTAHKICCFGRTEREIGFAWNVHLLLRCLLEARRGMGGGSGGGGVLTSHTGVVLRRQTLAPLQCRHGARRVFTGHADIACTKARSAVMCLGESRKG